MAKDSKDKVTEEVPKPSVSIGAVRIGQIGDYKPIPKFPKACPTC